MSISKKKFLILMAVLIWFILICDLLAFRYFMYWRFWWFDIIMHFLGGFWLALLAFYILYLSDLKEKIEIWTQRVQIGFFEKYSFLIISLMFVLSIGILWEIFELFFAFPLKQGYLFDTILDLIMDMMGWGVIYFIFLKKISISQNTEILE